MDVHGNAKIFENFDGNIEKKFSMSIDRYF